MASSGSPSTSTADDALRPATRGPARSPEVARRREGNGVLDFGDPERASSVWGQSSLFRDPRPASSWPFAMNDMGFAVTIPEMLLSPAHPGSADLPRQQATPCRLLSSCWPGAPLLAACLPGSALGFACGYRSRVTGSSGRAVSDLGRTGRRERPECGGNRVDAAGSPVLRKTAGVPPSGFEPLISTLKGSCPRPLDDGGAARTAV